MGTLSRRALLGWWGLAVFGGGGAGCGIKGPVRPPERGSPQPAPREAATSTTAR